MSHDFDEFMDRLLEDEAAARAAAAIPRRFTLVGTLVIFDDDLPELGGMHYEMHPPIRYPDPDPSKPARYGVRIPMSVWMLLGGFKHADPNRGLRISEWTGGAYYQFLMAHEFEPRRQHKAVYDEQLDAWCVYYLTDEELEELIDDVHPNLTWEERTQKLKDEKEGRYWNA